MNGERRSVNIAPNLAVVLAALEAILGQEGIDLFLSMLSTHTESICRPLVGPLQEKNYRPFRRPDAWAPLSTWLEVEHVMVEMFGHHYHLRELGQHSQDVAFGLRALANRFIKAFALMRWMTSPVMGLDQVEQVTKQYITNKILQWKKLAHGRGLMIVRHQSNVDSVLDDWGSWGSWILGFMDAILLLWRQKPEGKYQPSLSVAAVNPVALAEKLIRPGCAGIVSGQFWVRTGDRPVPYGRVMYAQTDKKLGIIMDHTDVTPEPDSTHRVPVVQLTDDVCTPCTKCRHADGRPMRHPIMRAGELYQHPDFPAAVEYSVYQMAYRPSWTRHLLPWTSRRFQKETKTEIKAVVDQRLLEAERARLVGTIPPTEEVFLGVVDRTLPTATLPTATLFWDVVGFTRNFGDMDAESMFALANRLHSLLAEVVTSHGGFIPKYLGDGAVACFTAGYLGDIRQVSASDLVQGALQASQLMHEAAKKLSQDLGLKIRLRIGVTYGPVAHGLLNGNTYDILGRPVNHAARLEAAAQTGSTYVDSGVIRALLNPDDPSSVVIPKEVGSFVCADWWSLEYEGVQRIKTDEIPAWRLHGRIAETTGLEPEPEPEDGGQVVSLADYREERA
ncbi:MAG: adenylate/guanylate cyclase domain-containing protein [Candidatus Magasanikbacteria bacterium]